MTSILTGKIGEDLAVDYLKKLGYKIVKRNFRIRGGEIDIIAQDGQVLVYVEVKTRTSTDFGLPEEAVTKSKLKFLERAAKFFRVKNPNLGQEERIDVVAIDLTHDHPAIRLIKNASF